jgi:hypothetical protein
MKTFRKKIPIIPFFILSLILTGCDFPFPSQSSIDHETSFEFTQEKIDFYQAQLQPNVPYITTDLPLPTLQNNPDNIVIAWHATGMEIDQTFARYPHPHQDFTAVLHADLTKGTTETTISFPVLVKSQLNVPTLDKRPILRIQLDQNRNESDIIYESYLRAQASVQADTNGDYQTLTIPGGLGIRTRGHSTRFMPKRPYRIRFDENTSLFGMKSAKNYILLANYLDRSLVRNSLITWISKFYDQTMYTLDYRFVDLYINQTYYGQYLLMERVEFQKNRLDIVPNLALEDAGFLVELDYQVYVQNQGNENLEWFKMNDTPYVIKEPNPLDINSGYQFKHTRYMNNYFHATRDALAGKVNYASFIDTENWLDYFLIQEIAKNVDIGWGSVYMVKETGGKLKHMPLWDFDLAIGNADYIEYGPEGHWGWVNNRNYFFTLLMNIPAMRTRFKEKLIAFQTNVLPQVITWLNENQTPLATLSQANFNLWPMNQCAGWCPIPNELRNLTTTQQQFNYLRSYFNQRTTWMINNI